MSTTYPQKVSLKTLFSDHLNKRGVSRNTLKNYLSDLNHFLEWLKRQYSAGIADADSLVLSLKSEVGSSYFGYLLEKQSSRKTTNRRLSTFRQFAQFLVNEQILDFDISRGVKNIRKSPKPRDEILKAFRKHLIEEGSSKNTVKNYVSDLRHFFGWLESQNIESYE